MDNTQCSATVGPAVAARLVGDDAEDAEDLIAIRPCADLKQFILTGDAIRIYRGASPSSASPTAMPGIAFSLSQLAHGKVSEVPGYGPAWFSFAALRPALTQVGREDVRALGPILFRAGRSEVLARTYWLLSRDLLQSSGLPDLPGMDLEQIADLALRAAALYDLGDSAQWRQGRRDRLRSGCQGYVLEVLEHLRAEADEASTEPERAMTDYWRGLLDWYAGPADTEAAKTGSTYPADHLARMAGALRAFLGGSTAAQHEAERRTAEILIDITQLIFAADPEPALGRLSAHPGQRPQSVDEYLAGLADDDRPVETPSPLLLGCLADYAVRHREVAQLGSGKRQPDGTAIDTLFQWLHEQMDMVRLPEHELGLMREIYRRDIAALESLRSALEGAARIEFEVLNPWLDQGIEQSLAIRIENRGDSPADDFWIELSVRDGAGREIARLPRVSEPRLPPGPLRRPLTLSVRGDGPTADLIIDHGLRDGRGEPRTWHQERRIEVREVPRRPWTLLGKPYEAGIAVFGPGRFFGRQTELTDIFSVLVAGITQPILLRGPRRMGKTSLMKQVEHLLAHPEGLGDYGLRQDQVDRLGTVRPVLYSLQALSETGRIGTDHFFAAVLDGAARALGHAGADWPTNAPDPVRTFRRALGRLLDAEPALGRRRLVIMVDEWDETSRPELRGLGINLRSVMLDEQRVNWIIASTWIMRHEGLSSSSPLHNMCHVLEIKAPGWKAARKVVEEPARRVDLHWHGHAVMAVLKQTGQWPYLIQMLGADAVKLINERRLRPVVDLAIVQEVLGRMVNGELKDAAAQFGSIFARDDQSGDDRDAVRTVGWLTLWVLGEAAPEPLSRQELHRRVERQAPAAVRDRPDWSDWYGRELADQIELLHQVQYTIEPDRHRRYEIRVPVFRAWFDATQRHLYDQMCERLAADLDRARSGDGP